MPQALSAAQLCYLLHPFFIIRIISFYICPKPSESFRNLDSFCPVDFLSSPLPSFYCTRTNQSFPHLLPYLSCFNTKAHCVSPCWAGLELMIFMPQLPECWDCKCGPTAQVISLHLKEGFPYLPFCLLSSDLGLSIFIGYSSCRADSS